MTDPRLLLALDGLVDARLEGTADGKRFVPVQPMRVSAPVAPLRRQPQLEAEQTSQLLFGERFDVLLVTDDYAFGQSGRDDYVGFVDLELLAPGISKPTHRVSALRTYAYSEPSIKTLPKGLYSMNALVEAETADGRFIKARDGGWFVTEHLAPLGVFEDNPVDVALRFVGAPYLWGGIESLGLDCSGLVQQALRACGMACPRDSDLQQALGHPVEGQSQLQRGDLIFWRGHVGLYCGNDQLLHANAFHMAVAVEPLSEALTRIGATSTGQPLCIRRP